METTLAPVKETTRLYDLVCETTTFRGDYPNIDVAPHIDMEALTEGDDNPFFATLKIGKVNSVSGNRRYYDSKAIEAMLNQTVGLGANMGHIENGKEDAHYPVPVGHWVGVKQVGETVWGKLYVDKTQPQIREMLRVKMRIGGTIATSIFGQAVQEYDAQRDVYNVSNIQYETIDLVAPQRAGLPELSNIPTITKETVSNSVNETEKPAKDVNPMENKYTVIQEMTVDDEPYIPKDVKAQVIALSAPNRLLETLQTTLGVESTDLEKRVGELLALETKFQSLQKEQLQIAITAEVNKQVLPGVQETEGVKAVREAVVNTLAAQNLSDAHQVPSAVAEAIKLPMIQTMASLASQAMGTLQGSQQASAGQDTTQAVWSKYMKSPFPETATANGGA